MLRSSPQGEEDQEGTIKGEAIIQLKKICCLTTWTIAYCLDRS